MNKRSAKYSINAPYCSFAFLSFVLCSLFILYIYFLSTSVVHVVLRKEYQEKSRLIESDIAMLEATFIERQHKVSEEIATLDNLTETNEKIFINRVPVAVAVSGRTSRP